MVSSGLPWRPNKESHPPHLYDKTSFESADEKWDKYETVGYTWLAKNHIYDTRAAHSKKETPVLYRYISRQQKVSKISRYTTANCHKETLDVFIYRDLFMHPCLFDSNQEWSIYTSYLLSFGLSHIFWQPLFC